MSTHYGTQTGRPVPRLVWVIIALLVLGGFIWSLYSNLNHVNVPEYQDTDEDHFKYGSIGSDTPAEGSNGLPYWIWRAMPQVCPDLLPGGYASLGFISEPGRDRPVGFSKRDVGTLDMVGLNCAVCHTASVRSAADAEPFAYPGSSSHQLDLWGYFNFLFTCGQDERFNVKAVMAVIDSISAGALSPFERLAYKQAIELSATSFKERAPLLAWVPERPEWGPGRVDTFNPYKTLLGFKTDMSNDHSIGTADFMTIWDQQAKEGLHVHWDGNNASVDERNISASLGAGATPATLDFDGIARIRKWIWTLKPQKYPFGVDYSRIEQGKSVYYRHCAGCHDRGGKYIGQVVQVSDIGVDPERANTFDDEMAGYMNRIGEGYPWAFKGFRVTDGYANAVLDGAWLRAPYLHNGSVPTMRDLLNPPEKRPAVFYRGYDVYDKDNMGFVSNVASANGRKYFKFDTRLRGNGNSGHLYGTQLSDAQKDALIEYLKTK